MKKDLLISRPGMYLASYNKKLNSGSLVLNFLIGLNYLIEGNLDSTVDIYIAVQTITIIFKSEKFEFAQLGISDDIALIFDINYHQKLIEDNLVIYFWRPIVWFSEFCSINIKDHKELYQHYFFYGESTRKNINLVQNNNHQYNIQFSFVANSSINIEPQLKIDDLLCLIEVWKKDISKNHLSDVSISTECVQYSDIFYGCRIHLGVSI